MLAHLRIRDFVLIDELDLELSPGFNVLTGETGAGKTMVGMDVIAQMHCATLIMTPSTAVATRARTLMPPSLETQRRISSESTVGSPWAIRTGYLTAHGAFRCLCRSVGATRGDDRLRAACLRGGPAQAAPARDPGAAGVEADWSFLNTEVYRDENVEVVETQDAHGVPVISATFSGG